jgi:hypothetical protein
LEGDCDAPVENEGVGDAEGVAVGIDESETTSTGVSARLYIRTSDNEPVKLLPPRPFQAILMAAEPSDGIEKD